MGNPPRDADTAVAQGRSGHPAFRHLNGDGATIFPHACALGAEGIVAKRRDRPYRSGRCADWVKVKNPARRPWPEEANPLAGATPSGSDGHRSTAQRGRTITRAAGPGAATGQLSQYENPDSIARPGDVASTKTPLSLDARALNCLGGRASNCCCVLSP